MGSGASGVFGENILRTMPCQRVVPGAAKNGLRIGAIALVEQRLDGMERGGPKGTKSLFPSLAQEPHLIRRGELQIGPMDCDGFADAGAGVVEEKQQGVIALSAFGTTIRLCQ